MRGRERNLFVEWILSLRPRLCQGKKEKKFFFSFFPNKTLQWFPNRPTCTRSEGREDLFVVVTVTALGKGERILFWSRSIFFAVRRPISAAHKEMTGNKSKEAPSLLWPLLPSSWVCMSETRHTGPLLSRRKEKELRASLACVRRERERPRSSPRLAVSLCQRLRGRRRKI